MTHRFTGSKKIQLKSCEIQSDGEACSKVCSGVQKHPVVTDLANYIVSHQDIQNGVRIHIIPL
jgi:hypothetical protein